MDKNKIVIIDNKYAEVIVEKQNKTHTIFIDIDDISIVGKHKWYINDSGYAMTHINNKNVRMHRLILKDKNYAIIDHINGNKLDNRKENLRNAIHTQNCANVLSRGKNISGIIGVSYDKINYKWRAQITINKKSINLGRFEDISQAIVARLIGEYVYFGTEFAPQRHLFEKYNIQEKVKNEKHVAR